MTCKRCGEGMFTTPSIILKPPKTAWILENVVHLFDKTMMDDEIAAAWAITSAEVLAKVLEDKGYL